MNTKLKGVVACSIVISLTSGAAVFLYLNLHTRGTKIVDRKITVDIGPFPNLPAEQRASLRRLSLELRRHPEAKAVRILAGKSAWRQGVMGYIRTSHEGNTRVFWYDDRFSSPVIGYVGGKLQGIGAEVLVSEEPIEVTAQRSGSVRDVERYNDRLRVQTGLDKPGQPPHQM